MSDQFSSLEVVLLHRVVSDHQQWISTMARGRIRHQNSKNHDGESVLTQTGQEEEIASPLPSPFTNHRRGIAKEKCVLASGYKGGYCKVRDTNC